MIKVVYVDTGEVNPGTGMRRLAECIDNKAFCAVDPQAGQVVVDIGIIHIKETSTLASDRFEAIIGIQWRLK